MRHQKVTEVFKKLGNGQMRRLNDFIHSPYFNNSETVTAIFDYLKTLYPHFPSEKITWEVILQTVSGLADENDLGKKLARLLDLVEKFLSIEHTHDRVLEQIGTMKAYKKMQLPLHFETIALQLRKELEQQPFRDFDYMWRVYKFEEEAFDGFDQLLVRTPDNTIEKVMDSMMRFYFTKKLCYMTEAVNRERLLGKAIADKYKTEILEFLNNTGKDADLYLLLYGNLFKMNLEKSPELAMPYYQQLKTTLNAFYDDIPEQEIRTICMHLQNYCLHLINHGNKDYLREFVEIIQFRISKGILLEDKRINPQDYKNIAGVAIMLNESTWADDFINAFRKNLPAQFRDDYYHLAMGQLHYHKKDFKQASRHLCIASHNKSDVYFGFSVKKLLIKIGFESKDAALESYIEAYRKHLERHRNETGENARLLEKFYKYSHLAEKACWNSEEMKILFGRLSAEENFPDKDWLLRLTNKKLRQPAVF